ncbi:MAG TPA: class I SAM-dependent methyltransferase [Steroidobacteraceae bacterium]
MNVPAGTQLFSDDAKTAQSLKTAISIVECPSCSLVQLSGEPVAYENVSSSSSFVSGQLTEHRLEQLRELFKMKGAKAGTGRLLEIGCGDGHLLENSKGLFEKSVGVEPTKKNAESAKSRGLDVHQMFMSKDATVAGGPFDYFCSFHVLEHVTDICSVLQGISKALTDDAVGIIEVPSTEAAIENKRFGDFMPDHLNYFVEGTLRMALEWNGFVVERIYRDWGREHLVAYVRKRSKVSSLNYIVDRQAALKDLVAKVNARKLPFAVWGVSHHLLPYIPTLSGIGSFIAVDGSSSKIGKFIPSTDISVRPKAALLDLPHCYVALTAPRFKDEIMGELSTIYKSTVEDTQLSTWLGFSVYECKSAA